jgi:hypothetical protein
MKAYGTSCHFITLFFSVYSRQILMKFGTRGVEELLFGGYDLVSK